MVGKSSSAWPLIVIFAVSPAIVTCGDIREFALQSAMPKQNQKLRSDLELGISEPSPKLESGSVIPVFNSLADNIAQFELKEFRIDISKIKLFSSSFPFDETIATNIALDLKNSNRASFPSKIAKPFDSYTALSVSDLKFNIVGSLKVPNEDPIRVSYIVTFTDETYINSEEGGDELNIDLTTKNLLQIKYDPMKWFDFNTDISNEIILSQLKDLDFKSENGVIIKEEFLNNFRDSMGYSLN